MTLDVFNRNGEVVAALEVEGATASKAEMERHYTQFAQIFLRHLGLGLKVMVRSNEKVTR